MSNFDFILNNVTEIDEDLERKAENLITIVNNLSKRYDNLFFKDYSSCNVLEERLSKSLIKSKRDVGIARTKELSKKNLSEIQQGIKECDDLLSVYKYVLASKNNTVPRDIILKKELPSKKELLEKLELIKEAYIQLMTLFKERVE